MRVITGKAKGRRLKAPKGLETRPTTDRIKEALFNILGPVLPDFSFLDLFAGTGAIGIEALSRGAGNVVFVEKDPRAIKVIKENLATTGLSEQADILPWDALKAIESLSRDRRKFDIIFMDPPYLKGFVQECMIKINQSDLITAGGMIITESSKLDVLPEEIGCLKRYRQDKYGDTLMSFFQRT